MPIERYSVGFSRGAPVAPGEAYAELLAGAADPVSIKSITVTTGSNVGGHVGLVRAHAIGTAAATGIYTGVSHRTQATAATGIARAHVAWTSSGVTPTGGIAKLKDEVLPVATGLTRTIWDCERDGELLVEPSKALLLVNVGSGIDGGGARINITWAEGRG